MDYFSFQDDMSEISKIKQGLMDDFNMKDEVSTGNSGSEGAQSFF